MSFPTDEVITFSSRHTGGISLSLSRYHRQWFITFPRAYGMIAPQRISKSLNDPKAASSETEEHSRNHFWLNSTVPSSPYDPEDTESKHIGSTIHELLDADPKIARLTGRKRMEVSRAYDGEGKETECLEVEVLIPESGLLNQCYYCLAWEVQGQEQRFKSCGDDAFWCSSCESKGAVASSVSGTLEKLTRDKIFPLIDKNTEARDSLYASP
ncbi:hypothetical protein D9613_008408 [Agrocybe pediades]|uniref:Uncharacterized protein n=1 Tax=Agrocybe pediades TaxID=84607 RepID=A0A8H4QT91_9AGAR|nr:hypothetical protein D9613_008408 [Agrocybe pediades]